MPGATERECSLAPDDFKRPEDAELEIRMALRGSMVRLSFLRVSSARLLDVFVLFSRRLVRGSIVVTCAFSRASSPHTGWL